MKKFIQSYLYEKKNYILLFMDLNINGKGEKKKKNYYFENCLDKKI